MPEEEAIFKVPSLKYFCTRLLSVKRARENDFLYIKSILGESKPEWNGFNTALTRDSGYSLHQLQMWHAFLFLGGTMAKHLDF